MTTSSINTTQNSTQHDKLVHSARTWVAQTFFGQMLKQMRDSPFKSELFNGGRGGEAFQGQLDQKLAEHMANGRVGERLVQSIVRHIEHKQGTSQGNFHGIPTALRA